MTETGWTTDSLKAYIDACADRFSKEMSNLDERVRERGELHEKARAIAMAASEKAIEKADTMNNLRFSQQNEWRNALNEVVASAMTRHDYEAAHGALVEKIDMLSSRLDRHEGAGSGVGTSWLTFVQVFMVAGIICAIVAEFFLR